MNDAAHTWAVVLAAGEGSRLRKLTTTASGTAVPKQFCSFLGGCSLLSDTIQRAQAVTGLRRICAIVAKQHEQWWKQPLQALQRSNVIVQPANRGTGNGILLSLLHVMKCDPQAALVFLPSDHYIDDEAILQQALRDAVQQVRHHPNSILLLGVQPDEVDPELGYIVPGVPEQALRRVGCFVEKPALKFAEALVASGALWNSFILVVRAATLLEIFEELFPDTVTELRAALDRDTHMPGSSLAIEHAYRDLGDIDFSRDVLQRLPERLRVVTVAACGWSDLGTPSRVGQAMWRASAIRFVDKERALDRPHPLVVLADQFLLHRNRSANPV